MSMFNTYNSSLTVLDLSKTATYALALNVASIVVSAAVVVA